MEAANQLHLVVVFDHTMVDIQARRQSSGTATLLNLNHISISFVSGREKMDITHDGA